MEITERQKQILFAIIEEYAEVAAPVGSVTLAKLFDVSSATIRAEMARLEEAGLITQPHTSAGRIPTDAGYRFYVNSLTEQTENATREPSRMLGSGTNTPNRNIHALEVRVNSQERTDYAIRR